MMAFRQLTLPLPLAAQTQCPLAAAPAPAVWRERPLGFTLIEAAVVVAIAAILAALAAPSFVSITQSYRVYAEVNAFIGDLQFARAEAIKEGATVTLCASTNATSNSPSCSGASNGWNAGWVVFSDPNNNRTINSGETVYRAQPGWKEGDSFVASNSIAALSYNKSGFASSLPAGATVTFTAHTTPSNSGATKCVALNQLGHQQLQKPGSGNCA